jgi:hypothetical protein
MIHALMELCDPARKQRSIHAIAVGPECPSVAREVPVLNSGQKASS